MCAWPFNQHEVRGMVAHAPHHEFLSSRQMTRGSRNVPRTTFRVHASDGTMWTILYTGEMDGQAAQGDEIAAYGYRRQAGVLLATEIWVSGYSGLDGDMVRMPSPIRIARKQVFF